MITLVIPTHFSICAVHEWTNEPLRVPELEFVTMPHVRTSLRIRSWPAILPWPGRCEMSFFFHFLERCRRIFDHSDQTIDIVEAGEVSFAVFASKASSDYAKHPAFINEQTRSWIPQRTKEARQVGLSLEYTADLTSHCNDRLTVSVPMALLSPAPFVKPPSL